MSISVFAVTKDPFDYLSTPNRFVDVGGIKYAYRMLGKKSEYPLVLLQHFRGSMDNWDPALIDALAAQRTVIVFDNKGVGLSAGETPDNFESMGNNAANFITALGYKKPELFNKSHLSLLTKQVPHLCSYLCATKHNNNDDKHKSLVYYRQLSWFRPQPH